MEQQRRSREVQIDISFHRLSHVLELIADSEISEAMFWVRQLRAGNKPAAQSRSWAAALDELGNDELMWLETVLCVRAQQVGREGAWRRFAESSYYREFVAFYR